MFYDVMLLSIFDHIKQMTHWSHSNQLALGTQVITPRCRATVAFSNFRKFSASSSWEDISWFASWVGVPCLGQSSPRNGTGSLGSVSKVVYHSHVSSKKTWHRWGYPNFVTTQKGSARDTLPIQKLTYLLLHCVHHHS